MQSTLTAIHELVKQRSAFVERLTAEIGSVIVGQRTMVDRLMNCLLTGGHVLLEGVPGLAKTLAVRTLADAVDAKFKRIQFTPDLLPADLVGTMIYNQRTGDFVARRGPIFTNVLLADEINRAPAKVQSALLEAMQERQVTIGDTTHPLPAPFFVLATQNPIEQEGTYPLPEAQLDRFMMKLHITYPERDEERAILERIAGQPEPHAKACVTIPEILAAREAVNQVYVDERVKDYIVELVRTTRKPEAHGLTALRALVEYGASPRATLALTQAARANAFLQHRGFTTPDDVKSVGPDVLRHRVILTYEAEAENVTAEDVLQKIFDAVPVP